MCSLWSMFFDFWYDEYVWNLQYGIKGGQNECAMWILNMFQEGLLLVGLYHLFIVFAYFCMFTCTCLSNAYVWFDFCGEVTR